MCSACSQVPATPQQVARSLSFGGGTLEEPAAEEKPAAPEPVPPSVPGQQATVGYSAAKKRLSRLMEPLASGKYKVPAELVKEWQTGDKDHLIEEWLSAGLLKDCC